MISVLIVDDEPAVCRLLRHLIRWEELDMTLSGFVYDGQEALELLEEKKPDIVITQTSHLNKCLCTLKIQ